MSAQITPSPSRQGIYQKAHGLKLNGMKSFNPIVPPSSFGRRGPNPVPAGSLRPARAAPVVVGFEGPVLVQPQVLGLLVRELCQVCVEGREVEARHVFV